MKKLISFITSGMIAVIPSLQVQLYACADEFSVPAVSEKVINLTDTSITETFNSNKQESENPPVTTDITGNSNTDEPILTTQAPPSAGEIRAELLCDEAFSINVGEEIDLNDIKLKLRAWGFDSTDDYYKVNPEELNYEFSIGSGKHSECYTYDISEVDTSKAGSYAMHIIPIPYASDKFLIENSTSEKIPNGEYEFVMQGGPFKDFYININVTDPAVTTTDESQFPYTTTVPITKGEVRIKIECNQNDGNFPTVQLGEKLDLNDINLSISACGIDSDGDWYEVASDQLNYNFSIGSGKHSKLYNYDTSEVDNATSAGNYPIYIEPIPYASDTFVLENSLSSKLPNGEYEFKLQSTYANDYKDGFYIYVNVIDPSAPQTTEPNQTIMTTTTFPICIMTTEKVTSEETRTDINSATETTTAEIIAGDYAIKLEYDDSPMKIGEKRAIHVYNPITGEPENITESSFDSNITASYSPENDILYVTALAPGDVKIYIFGTGCAFGNYAYLTVTDEQFSENISTTLNTTTEITETTTTTMSSNSQIPAISTEYDTNTTVVVMDYRTQLEYDDSPMKIGEKRAIRLYNPATETASGAYISEASSNISVSYEPGSDTVYITALESGDITLYIHESSCAFGNYVNITITEELFSENNTTTEENNNDTNNTPPLPEQLPQTGYSDIYKWIVCFAVLITTAGTSATIHSKKKVK